MEFWNERTVKAAKNHHCDACHTTICKGEKHVVMSGKDDGYFFSMRNHADCREVEIAMWKERGGHFDDDWVALCDIEEPDEAAWVAEKFPAVFARVAHLYADQRSDL